jgi:hypothetical protein
LKNYQKKEPQSLDLNKDNIEQQFNKPVARYHYSLGHIVSFISLTLMSLSMRGTRKAMSFFSSLFPKGKSSKTPCWYSGRLWLLKLGYYKLHASKNTSGDWIWIVDHATQWGSEKCFTVLGVQASKLPKSKILSLDDVEPLMILPVTDSNGDIVCNQLKQLALQVGIPKAIVADAGPDIKSGIEKFCKHTQGTVYLYDIKHLIVSSRF